MNPYRTLGLYLAVCSPLWSAPVQTGAYWEGRVGDYGYTLKWQSQTQAKEGSVHYARGSQWIPITIQGPDANGQLVLVEKSAGKELGRLDLTLADSGQSLVGFWHNDQKQLPVHLRLVAKQWTEQFTGPSWQSSCENWTYSTARPGSDTCTPPEWVQDAPDSADQTQNAMETAWSGESSTQVEFLTPHFTILTRSYYDYTGGAHPNHSTDPQSWFKKKSGWTQLKLGDLFNPNTLKQLRKVVHSQIVQQAEGAHNLWDDAQKGQYVQAESTNFILTPQGIELTYSPYQIACYAAGYFSATVPWRALGKSTQNSALIQKFLQEVQGIHE